MTSNNTVTYLICNKDNKQVGTHTQNVMCKRCNDDLLKFIPAEDFTIEYYDEDDWEESKPIPLNEWLDQNPAEFTFKNFEPGDNVRFLTKVDGKFKRINVEIVERFKGKWNPFYTVKLEDGTLIEDVDQGKVLPLK